MRAQPDKVRDYECEVCISIPAETPADAGLQFAERLDQPENVTHAIVTDDETRERWLVNLETGEAGLMPVLPADPVLITALLQLQNMRDAAVKFMAALEEEFPDENVSIRVPEMADLAAVVLDYDHRRAKERRAREERRNARSEQE